MEAKQTPLIELLERVPKDARLVVEHNQFSSSSYPVGRLCHEAAAAIREALADHTEQPLEMVAEQPAQQWNAGVPPLYPEPEPGVSFKVAYEQPAQQQEPVAYIRKDQLQKAAQSPMLCEVTPEPRQDRIGIHTSPQPSKPWVGLTDEEIEQVCVPLGAAMLSFTEVARAIEAKLKEKNNG